MSGKLQADVRSSLRPPAELVEFVSGGCAALTSICIVFPLHKTIFVQQLQGVRLRSAAHQVFIRDLRYLYRGLFPPMCQKTASLSIMFGVYGQCHRALHQRHPDSNVQLQKAAAALFAGLCEAVLMPFERVQTLLQDRRFHGQFRNTFHTFGELWRAQGLRELYRGLTPIMLRNGSSNVVYFLVRDRFGTSSPPQPRGRVDAHWLWKTISDFVNGAGLGAGLGVATYPLNVAKTRMQTRVGGPFVRFTETLRQVYVERGSSVKKLYRGVPANCVRSMLSWGIITMFYEWYRSALTW